MTRNTLNPSEAQEEKPAIRDIVVFSVAKIGNEKVNSVDARTLHKALESGRDFSEWVKAKVVNNPFFIEKRDFILLPKIGEQTCNIGRDGHNRQDYALTLDAARKLAEKPKSLAEDASSISHTHLVMNNRVGFW